MHFVEKCEENFNTIDNFQLRCKNTLRQKNGSANGIFLPEEPDCNCCSYRLRYCLYSNEEAEDDGASD